MQNDRLHWHVGIGPAVRIELGDDMAQLQVEEEHLLGKKPMQMDLLIIKKKKGATIEKNIGQIFRTYNIVEYKSPTDYLSVNDFYKVYGYACFYQADTDKVLEIDPGEITISFITGHYPEKMLEHIRDTRGITAIRREAGIYDLTGDFFPMQVIVTKELTKEKNYWLQSMRNDLKPGGEIRELIARYETKKQNRDYQSVMNLILHANWEKVKEEKKMCEALRELFAEELQESWAEGEARGETRGRMEGRTEGRTEGEARVTRLNLELIKQQKYQELEKASKNREYREKMYKMYGI